MKTKKDGSPYGKPCPSCGKTIDYRSALCWDCTWAAKPKKRCIDCGSVIRPSQDRCWECHKARIAASNKHCQDCGKPVSYGGRTRCRACHRKWVASEATRWACIECGAAVERRVKRCSKCNKAHLSTRGTYERTPANRAKMSRSLKGKPKPALRGKKRSLRTKLKMRAWWTEKRKEAASRKWKGSGNPGYVHGKRCRPWPRQFNARLRAMVRRRDDDTCQICMTQHAYRSPKLAVHHIDYDKGNNSPENLITVCLSCHAKTNFNRGHWKSLLEQLQARRARSGSLPASGHPGASTSPNP